MPSDDHFLLWWWHWSQFTRRTATLKLLVWQSWSKLTILLLLAVSMLCDALDSVALCTALQAKTLDFAELNFLADTCIADLEAMMNSPDEADEMKTRFECEILFHISRTSLIISMGTLKIVEEL